MALRHFVGFRVHFDRSLFIEIDVPNVQALVGVSNFFAIWRPLRRIEEGWRIAEIEFTNIAHTVLIADVEFVFAGLIREIGD